MPVPLLGRLRRCVAEGRSDAPGPVVDALGRIGLVGYGVVHLLVAWLALAIVLGVPGVSADAQGAVGTLARTRFGGVALAVGVAGLLAFAVWQLAAAAVGFRWAKGNERVRKRAGAIAKAIAVTARARITTAAEPRTIRPAGRASRSALTDLAPASPESSPRPSR